jgi:hypothetical protein
VNVVTAAVSEPAPSGSGWVWLSWRLRDARQCSIPFEGEVCGLLTLLQT